jgi:hypothetical protein|nr:MAG TPA: hypothetical protein [Caudoviricetes sp.]
MPKYEVTLLCADSAGYEDTVCYIVDAKNSTEAVNLAIAKSKARTEVLKNG